MSDLVILHSFLLIASSAVKMSLIVLGVVTLFIKCPKSETQIDRIENYVHAYAFIIIGCI